MKRALMAATAATMAVGGALPVAADAAEIAVPACSPFLEGERTVAVQGTGFAPNSEVTLTAGDQKLGTARANEDGAFRADAFGPAFSSERKNVQTFDLLAKDAEGTSATADLQMTRINATLPAKARPTSRVTYRVYGFTPGRTVYVHVRRGSKTLASHKIGPAAAPCGTASRRLRYMPVTNAAAGSYVYWFQASKRFDPDVASVRLPVEIVRRSGAEGR
ncbi:MAG TPA: hypothetical protein VN238_17260 [Solirubrobacteraceae bacterium]|nr:hypothetical protein [Solirubrobacteraceae bacterium]